LSVRQYLRLAATKANAAKEVALLLRAEGHELPLQRDKYEL
jgi:hypothetical protein